MIIEAKPILLRTKEAYQLLLQVRSAELETGFNIRNNNPYDKMQALRADIEAIEDMISAIDNEINTKH